MSNEARTITSIAELESTTGRGPDFRYTFDELAIHVNEIKERLARHSGASAALTVAGDLMEDDLQSRLHLAELAAHALVALADSDWLEGSDE